MHDGTFVTSTSRTMGLSLCKPLVRGLSLVSNEQGFAYWQTRVTALSDTLLHPDELTSFTILIHSYAFLYILIHLSPFLYILIHSYTFFTFLYILIHPTFVKALTAV